MGESAGNRTNTSSLFSGDLSLISLVGHAWQGTHVASVTTGHCCTMYIFLALPADMLSLSEVCLVLPVLPRKVPLVRHSQWCWQTIRKSLNRLYIFSVDILSEHSCSEAVCSSGADQLPAALSRLSVMGFLPLFMRMTFKAA